MSPSSQQVRRRIAPGIVERHARACGLGAGRRRCSCSPTYAARVDVGKGADHRSRSASFATLPAAAAWVETTRWALRAGPVPQPRRAAPALRDAAVSFLHRARAGEP